ncbi:MAG: dTDP-4-dehydrorhamnose 3,5-epimerase [Acidimicrobiales bacterium]
MSSAFVEFEVHPGSIDGLLHLTMKQAADERGAVREVYRASAFDVAGLPLGPWVQVNVTESKRGAVRGLHAEDMNKLVAVVAGAAFGVYLDMRPESPTHGGVETAELVPGVQVFVPRGVANGFQAVAPGVTQYLYVFDKEWQPGMGGRACSPLDPGLGIQWPLAIDDEDRAQISLKDRDAPMFAPRSDDR